MPGSAMRSGKDIGEFIDDREPRVNVLVGYPFVKKAMMDMLYRYRHVVRFVMDSGAFQAAKANHKGINLDTYCSFVEDMPVKPWRYFMLDVIGDTQRTRSNYEAMLDRGLSPMAIFTRGESREVLEHYYATSEVIGVGGMVDTPRWYAFVNALTKAAGERHLHWLGFTRLNYLKHYRPYMCDSAAWVNGSRFGGLRLYMGHGQMTVLLRTKFAEQIRDPRIEARIRHFGFEPMALRNYSAWGGLRSIGRQLSAVSALAFSLDVQRNLGTLLFNAINNPLDIQVMSEAFIHQRGLYERQPVTSSLTSPIASTRHPLGRAGLDHVPLLGEGAL